MKTPLRFALGSLLILAFLPPSVGIAQQSNPPGVSLRLRLKDGKAKFKQGEIITIEMLFASSRPDTYRLDARTYDRSGHLVADTYHVEPEVGVTEPLFDYMQSGMFGGSMGGLAPTPPTLQSKPYIIAQDLNEFVRFDRPGKYRLYVSNNRIGRLDPNSPHRVIEQFRATSNTIEIEILPADPDSQKQKLQQALAIIDDDKQMDRRPGCRALRFLDSEDAEAEMIRRYRGNTDGCDGEFHFGLVSSPRRDSVIDQMESKLASPEHPITGSFINTLSTLAYLAQFRTPMQPFPSVEGDAEKLKQWQDEMKRRREAFQEIRAHYAEQISEVISRKEKPARAVSLETFLQFEANIPKERRTPARVARGNQIAAALPGIFFDLPENRQYALLAFSWKQIANPALLPALRQLIERPSSSQEGSLSDLRGIALYRMYELAADEGRRAIIKEILRTPLRVRSQTLSILPDETLPELDQLLSEKLAQLDSEQRFQLIADHSVLIARYATSASLSDVTAAVGDKIGKMPCLFQAPLLAYFLRVDPRQGAEVLEKALAARKDTRCFESELGEVANLFMSPEVKQAAINHLNDPNMVVSIQAAAVLSKHSTVEDETLLWNRLQQWREEWQGRNPELELKTNDEDGLSIRPVQVELELVRAIARGRGWLMDSDRFKRLQQLCLTPGALQELTSVMRESERREIDISQSYPVGHHYFRVAQYEFRSFDDFKEKLGQFPGGTTFTASRSRNGDLLVERLFDKIEEFLKAGGMKLDSAIP
jgi:hypothetical protein